MNCMQFLSFNMFRTIGIKTEHAKSDYHFDSLNKIAQADVILFPEYWQIHSIIYGMKKPIFPSAATFHLGHDKIEMTRIFKTVIPDNIPRTEIYGKNEFTISRVLDQFSFPFVAKTVRSSMGQGVHLIKNDADWDKYVAQHDTFYVQEYIPNEKDLRVVVVGDHVLAAYWRVGGTEFLNNVAQGGVLDFENIPQEALDFVLTLAKQLDIDHAGFDLIFRDGHIYVLEFNVFFGGEGLNHLGIHAPDTILEYVERKYGSS
ncbi:ATP-grasp domain-containing protein [Exiguobacterium sp. RIT594]|nr:ATP-grasp domain-containing protein [Exiguobacterium sp. RIT594]